MVGELAKSKFYTLRIPQKVKIVFSCVKDGYVERVSVDAALKCTHGFVNDIRTLDLARRKTGLNWSALKDEMYSCDVVFPWQPEPLLKEKIVSGQTATIFSSLVAFFLDFAGIRSA